MEVKAKNLGNQVTYSNSNFVGTIEKSTVFLIKTPIFQGSISSKIPKKLACAFIGYDPGVTQRSI